MWVVMTVAMMLPSLAPSLWRYRSTAATASVRRGGLLTVVVAAGYFLVWTVVGALAFGLGVGWAGAAMRQPALARGVPVAAGVVVLIAGGVQFTAWKQRQLACCRESPARFLALPSSVGAAWQHGLRLGLHCSCSCAGLTAILLVLGVMDLRTMILVTAAVTLERLAPDGERAARAVGVVAAGAGAVLIARAAGL